MDIINNLVFTLNTVLPIILLILLGYALKKINFFSEGFLKTANKFCFYVALPILLFKNVFDANLNEINWYLILFAVLSILAIFLIGFVFVIFFTNLPEKRGVLWQNIFRSNYAYIGIPLATMLYANTALESDAKMAASLIAAFSVPVFNILAVISLTAFNKNEENKVSIIGIFKKIITNPLIIGVFLGFCALFIRTLTNTQIDSIKDIFLYRGVKSLSEIASPLSLIVLGGGFTFGAIKGLYKYVSFGVITRCIFVPIFGLSLAALYGFKSFELGALIALFASPVAVSSAIMATEMGSDGELAGQLVIWTTIASSVTIFISIFIFKSLGYL